MSWQAKVKFMCLCAQSFSRARLFVTPWTVAHQAPLSMRFSKSRSSKITEAEFIQVHPSQPVVCDHFWCLKGTSPPLSQLQLPNQRLCAVR